MSKENEFQSMNRWVPATHNESMSSRGKSVAVQFEGPNMETTNWQQVLGFPDDQYPGSVSYYQPVQDLEDLDPHLQSDRNGCQSDLPSSFMALLGVHGSYDLDDPLLESQGISVSEGYPSIYGNLSEGVGTSENSCAGVNTLPMASQFVAHNSSQSPQSAVQDRIFQSVNRPVIPNDQYLITSACNASKDAFQLPEDGFVFPSQLEYYRHLPAKTETEASFSQTSEFFQHTLVTPNQPIKFQDNKQYEILELPEPDRHFILGGDKHIRLAENGTRKSYKFRQPCDETSYKISTPEKLMGNDREPSRVNNLSETPQHRTPKRRKHRPKVVREGQPKKIPKSETLKNPKSSERPKRKYTRKISSKASEIQPNEVEEGTRNSSEATAANSCKRALSFELQKIAEQREANSNTQAELLHQMSERGFNLNSDKHATVICCTDNKIVQAESVVQMGGQNELPPIIRSAEQTNILAHSMPQGTTINRPRAVRPPPTWATTVQDLLVGNVKSAGSMTNSGKATLNPNSQAFPMYTTEAGMAGAQSVLQCGQNKLQTIYQHTSTTGNFNHSMPQQTTNTVTHAARHPPKATTYQELLIGNRYCAQSTVSPQNVNVNQTNQRSCYNPAQSFSHAENTHENLDECDQILLYRSTQPMMITSNSVQHEARRSKRERDLIGEQQQFHSITPINSSMLSRVVNQVDGHSSWYVLQKELQEAEKKQRTEHIPYMRSSLFNPYPWTSYAINISHSAEFMRTERVKSGVSTLPAAFDHSSKLQISSEQPSYFSQLQKRGNPANVQASPSLIPVSESNLQTVPAITLLSDSQQITKDSSSIITTKHYSRPTASGLLVTTIRNAALPGDVQEITTIVTNRSSKKVAAESSVSRRKMGNESKDHQPTSSRKRGQLRKKDIRDLIDDIIYQMEHLKLDDVSENAIVQPENAIVPFKEGGPVVMYQAKKRKPRPKVDLDHESQRMWKQLTGKDGTEGVEGTDTDKEKWWEDERKLFGERASLFIGRMHLVQGDRQFSRWKGSVVDSVVGVFLTQSVTDVVSSSAFMDLAARFPLNTSRARCSTDDGTINEDPEICIIDLENAIPNNDSKQALSNGNPMASKIEGKIVTSDTEIMNSVDNHIKGGSEENLSLDSVDAICLTKGGPYFRPDSEVDDQLSTHNPLSVSKTNKSTGLGQGSPRGNPLEYQVHSFHHSENAQQPTVPSCDYQLYAQLNSSQRASLKDCQPLLGGESMSSCPASHAAEGSSNISGFKLKNRKNLGQNGKQRKNTEPRSNLNEQPGSYIVRKEGTLIPASIKETTQHSCNDDKHESVIFHSDRTSAIEETELILREHGLSGIANINSKDNNPKTRRRKQDADKKLIDWDILRKEAQRNNRRSSNKDAMDSINYETMRHTDVKEIADTIRKRGMNSMLAERIKDFLNRMVTDHGSIDLEWLRDVPPEKAKDYLLSIRGLGLKSTECVRLLTLHHLAFPVDTNVGRIAVRLGWVPLQPLPESLELHLLEMYPVLETIQMYLWPRLCKLDQRTLYELHYQMITFGKVFCTKSKPNCNACPMRAECRHFASAFASARLALPGPEERDTVPSGVSVPSDRIPAIDISFQPLLELDNQLFGVERSTESTCEPTVELPATPEQEPEEASEFDIEDLFGEDPDEFPAIKLNFHDLKSHMRENNLDVQGDEMSKALVALTAEAASLPSQKLKNASRLRTEHQVYELPDSHPLLCKMDRREPDDPSPYLLAIWMPGETAYSTQPPESEYQSEDPCKMCSEKTCFSCNSKREADSNIVRGTLLIPCRTAMRGSFPLNGTYFQVNEMFADHESSMNPIDVPREYIWSLPRRTVYFGTAVSTIFKGMSTEEIQYCFWRGFVCVRGFDQRYRAPRPLLARLHRRSSKLVNKSKDEKK